MAGPLRRSNLYLALCAGLLALAGLLWTHALLPGAADSARLASQRQLVRELGLTDLCLASEARYTRHLSQADLFAAFQDYPVSLDHFPSGALLPPPRFAGQKVWGRSLRPARPGRAGQGANQKPGPGSK